MYIVSDSSYYLSLLVLLAIATYTHKDNTNSNVAGVYSKLSTVLESSKEKFPMNLTEFIH